MLPLLLIMFFFQIRLHTLREIQHTRNSDTACSKFRKYRNSDTLQDPIQHCKIQIQQRNRTSSLYSNDQSNFTDESEQHLSCLLTVFTTQAPFFSIPSSGSSSSFYDACDKRDYCSRVQD